MTKITITVDSDDASRGSGAAVEPVQTSPERGAPTGLSASPPSASPPPDVLAQAAAVGALNAGPGPSLASLGQGSAPIASSVGGTSASTSHDVVSGGAAPHHAD